MRRYARLVLAIVVIAALTVGAEAQMKTVLVEQHTGAWCGWCPDGTVKVGEIVELYGDRVIGVKIHTGDAMAIPEQSILADTLGLSGVPTASIDRKSFGGSVFLSRGQWKAACESQMTQRAKAEVDCFYTFDRRTRVVTIDVVANITESMDVPVRFNAFIVEDDVTGTGSGYDQSNYLSGRSGYEDNPYYSQPSKIVGYHHMKVVRRALGGAWGLAGDLPASVAAGDLYTHQFKTQIDTRWDMDSLLFVGMLQADAQDNKEIINSAVAIEGGSLLNRIIDPNTPAARALASGSDLVNAYTLENLTNQEQTYTVTLSTTARTPADWSAEFAGGTTELAAAGSEPAVGEVVVPAGSTMEFSLTLKMGSTLGVGDAEVIFELEGTATVTRSRIVSAITTEIEYLLLESGPAYSMLPYLSDTACADVTALDSSAYGDFADQLNNVKMIIWNKGPADGLSPEEMAMIKSSEGVNHFICGDYVIGGLAHSDDLDYFGLEWIGWNLEAQGPDGTVWLSGQDGDVITGDLGGPIEGRLMQYYINMVKILDTDHVFPIMHYQNPGMRRYNGNSLYTPADETIFAVRSTKNNTRTVLLGICPYVIAEEAIRRTLVGNVLNWLGVEAPAEDPDDGTTLMEGFETGNLGACDWTCFGDAPWIATSDQKNSGSYSAQAGLVVDDQTSSLTVTLDCTSGSISFYFKVSSEASYDLLTFSIDESEKGQWSGEEDWTGVSFPVSEGTRTFTWTYTKDSSSSVGSDTCWIDDVTFPIQ